jgi:phosphatidate cytidylyltransferase
MLRARLWTGAVLILLVLGILFVDQRFGPWYPFFLLAMTGILLAACLELVVLLGPVPHLPAWFCCTSVAVLVLANWPAPVLAHWHVQTDPWHWVVGAFAGVVLAAFLLEMLNFQKPGSSVVRVAVTVWVAAYLGLLPCFFLQLRWPPAEGPPYHGTLAVALAVFVPKCGDIGAYTTGRLIGRHRMTPVLSPKKTWEGFAGGLLASVAVAFLLYQFDPVLQKEPWAALGFGVTVWLASVLGDLAESLVKRDCQRKDASQAMPGFGGMLDVIDSVIFAGPVAYLWLRLA